MAISKAIQYCKDSNYDQNPVLTFKAMKRKLMKGFLLEIIDPAACIEGITNIIMVNWDSCLLTALREKYPNTDFFLVRIFPYSDWIDLLRKPRYSVGIRENTNQKKPRIWILFTQCWSRRYSGSAKQVLLFYKWSFVVR